MPTNTPHRALIVIDVQNDYVDGTLPIEHPRIDVSLANVGE
jgi:nicotinamidase-related amidase